MSERLDAGESEPPPEAPHKPEADECCRSGCERCVYDVYREAMERYEIALEAWKRRHGGLENAGLRKGPAAGYIAGDLNAFPGTDGRGKSLKS